MSSGYSSPYEDDKESIEHAAVIYRRVHPDFRRWPDDNVEPTIHYSAFQDLSAEEAAERGYPGPAMSVYLAHLVEESGRTPRELLDDFGPRYGLASLKVADIRAAMQGINHWPDKGEYAHAVVFPLMRSRRSTGERKKLAKAAEWVVTPSCR